MQRWCCSIAPMSTSAIGTSSALLVARFAINTLTPPRQLPNPFTTSLEQRVDGKLVVITGGSSGIGRRLAERLAAAGAVVVIVARRQSELDEVVVGITERGGIAHALPADLSTNDGVNHVADVILREFGVPDILVNNAGRSIMRSLAAAEHRLHDYERLMRINYLAGVGLTLRLLPGMQARGSGHIVHSSSIGAVANLPRFSAYIGSKAALDAVLRVAEVESCHANVKFTNVHIPLTDTDMAAAPEFRDNGFNRLTLDQATNMMIDAIRRQPRHIENPLGTLYASVYAVAPGLANRLQNHLHRIQPEGAPVG